MNEAIDTAMQWQMLKAEVMKSIDQEAKDRQARMTSDRIQSTEDR
jgi:hypothetical protein